MGNRLLLLLGVLLCAASAYAQDVFKRDGIYYCVIDSASVGVYPSSNAVGGVVVIPPNVHRKGRTYTVKSILPNAFNHCFGITEVVLPESLERIGDNAFLMCRSLRRVVFPRSLRFVGRGCFIGCDALETRLPDGVTVDTIPSDDD